MIKIVGELVVNGDTMELAQGIRQENYKVNTPSKYQKHLGKDPFISEQLSEMLGCRPERVDYVFFSSKEGAEPHVDKLSLSQYEEKTILIPLILPNGTSKLIVDGWTHELGYFLCYEFNHTQIHSLELEDKDSGCVLIMAAVLK